MFKRLINEIKVGGILNAKQENKLYCYLGFIKGTKKIIISFGLLIIGLFIVYIGLGRNFIMEEKSLYFIITGSILITISIYYYTNRNYYKRILAYFDAVNYYLEYTFSKYKGYEVLYVKNLVSINNHLISPKIYLLSDGYNFLIYDDILKLSKYSLPEPLWVGFENKFLEYNYNTIDKAPIIFKYNDVKSFRLMGEVEKEAKFIPSKLLSKRINEKINDNIFALDQRPLSKNFVLLTLNNGVAYKLDTAIYEWCIKMLPLKEAK